MKKILVDIYKSNNPFSGLGQFSINFAQELMRQKSKDLDLTLLTPPKNTFQSNKEIHILKDHIQSRYFPFLNPTVDIWHSLYQFPSHMPNKRSKQILTIHDLNFLTEKNSTKAHKYLKRLQKNVDRAHSITTISNYTKSVIQENLDLKGKEIRVIYNGVKLDAPSKIEKPKYIQNQKFFFSIGIFNAKKNFHVLVDMMSLNKDYSLILAGNHHTEYGKEIEAKIKKLNLSDRVILAGNVGNSEKYWLYKNCEALLFPSLAEGFGLPVIEAMILGKPVFLSKYASLPEIGGDLAFYFDDFEPQTMKSLIESKLSEFEMISEEKGKEIKKYAAQFTWENAIKQYLQLYTELSD